MASAVGTRISLFSADPFATAQTTGSSRSALTPVTCWALRARSSPRTPAVFLAATLVITATSSSNVAISSMRVRRLETAICASWREKHECRQLRSRFLSQHVGIAAHRERLPRDGPAQRARHVDYIVRKLLRRHVLLERRERERELLHLLVADALRLRLGRQHALLPITRDDARQQRIHAN